MDKSIIAGITPFTTIDYPGELAAVLFTRGCPLRCRYCHNPSLVDAKGYENNLTDEEVFTFLEEHRNKLSGIVLSGGEPLLTARLYPADFGKLVENIKQLGYNLKLDTNAVYWNAEMTPRLFNMFDMFAVDLKRPDEHSPQDEGIHAALRDIVKSGKPYEVRTTVHKSLLSEMDLIAIRKDFLDCHNIPYDKWYLQQFHKGELLDNTINDETTYTDEELAQTVMLLGCKVRGIKED